MKEIIKTDKKKKNLYAVYGTLMRGEGNNRILRVPGCKFKGLTKTKPEFNLYHLGGFPGLKEGGDTAVEIEVWEVDCEVTEQRLDNLEGYEEGRENNFYNKIKIPTKFGEAFIYTYNHQINPQNLIKNGKWKKRNA